MDQPHAVAFTAFADAWPKTMETEIGDAQCVTGAGRNFDFDMYHTLFESPIQCITWYFMLKTESVVTSTD